MVKIVITGGSSYLAGHLIRQLQDNTDDLITEIHTIDRKNKPCQLFDYQNGTIPITHHCCDLLNRECVDTVLKDASVVFHLARKQFQYLICNDNKTLNEQYKRDNLTAVSTLLDAMFASNVQNLVFMGDAYANLPCEDNFGNSEEIHHELPSSFILGYYGETRTKAELMARNKVGTTMANGNPFQATFLRPSLLYGEGETKLPEVLRQVAQTHNGFIPNIQGPSNGLLQYMYAGNLAILMEENMRLLLTDPDKCNGEFFYCMDQTECILFSNFASPVLQCYGMQLAKPSGLLWNYSRLLWLEYFSKRGREAGNELSLTAFRFLFVHAAGFSNRKQQLIFKFRPQTPQNQLFKRTAAWIQANLVNSEIVESNESNENNEINEISAESQKQQRSVLRMG